MSAHAQMRESAQLAFVNVPIQFFREWHLAHGSLFSRNDNNLVLNNLQFHDFVLEIVTKMAPSAVHEDCLILALAKIARVPRVDNLSIFRHCSEKRFSTAEIAFEIMNRPLLFQMPNQFDPSG